MSTRQKKVVTKVFFGICVFWALLSFSVLVANSETVSKPKQIVLKTVTLLKSGHPVNYPVDWIAQEIKNRSKGEVIIEVLGGPEAIPAFEQTEALLRGVIDFYVPGSSYVQTVWREAIVFPLSRLTPTEERKKGAFDLLRESAKKHGLYYLGRAVYPRGYYMYINSPVKSPDELRGKKIRGAPIYARFIKALGASMVTIPFSDMYTAMERGLVDGYCWPPSICEYGLEQVTKYMINHPYYGANILVVMRQDTWDKLPKHLQKLLEEVVEEQETGLEQRWRDLWNGEIREMSAKGVKLIEFTPDDARRYVNLAYDEAWKEVLEKSPTYGPKLKEIMLPKN